MDIQLTIFEKLTLPFVPEVRTINPIIESQ